MHRTLNLIGVALIVAGFLCIFISENWTWKGPKVDGGDKNWEASAIHSLVGLLCIILAWIQSLVTFVRPSPSSAIRRLFNWVHRSTGVVAFILAGL
uniref:Cytochrome b561 domain-containing protein n=1 Tax=Plectus sambesii TaxID=2011161 RepID=A0A914XA03_9BILA